LVFLIKKHETGVMSFLAGLMLGALRIPLQRATEAASQEELKLAIAAALAGIFVVLLTEWLAGKKEEMAIKGKGNIKKNLRR